ncbi:hypothetical protein [Phenylobacterium sp.]|jgi:hypothetical protein|uniref:hypothetical protein n=1 Tax=Phenylobacterium sp. TaxID=1871053 RepID=UPI0037C88D1A
MMNANVRRLVFDLSPRWLVWVQILFWLFLGASAAMGASSHESNSPGALLGLCGYTWAMTCTNKFNSWKTLPFSIHDIKLSQCFVLLGLPIFIVLSANIIGLLVSILFSRFTADPVHTLAKISCQLLLPISISLSFYASYLSPVLLRNFCNSLSLISVFISIALGWNLTFDINSSQSVLILTITFGVIAILVCISALVWNQYLPLVSPGKSNPSRGARPSEPSPSTLSRAYQPPRGRSGVWRLFASTIGRIAPYGGVASCLLAFVVLTPKSGPFPVFDRPMLALGLAALFCSVLVVLALWEPQRVRAGLPVSALGRTFALHLVVPAFLLPTWGLIFALPAFLRPDALTSHWWILCGFTSLVALSFGAASLPAGLRFGRSGIWLVYGVFNAVSLVISLQPTQFGKRWALEGQLSLRDLSIIGVLVIILISGWIWTYLELAFWRKAYQPQSLIPTRWRGAAN